MAGVVVEEGVEGFSDKIPHELTPCLLHGTCFFLLVVNQMYKCCHHFRTTYGLPLSPESTLWNTAPPVPTAGAEPNFHGCMLTRSRGQDQIP